MDKLNLKFKLSFLRKMMSLNIEGLDKKQLQTKFQQNVKMKCKTFCKGNHFQSFNLLNLKYI